MNYYIHFGNTPFVDAINQITAYTLEIHLRYYKPNYYIPFRNTPCVDNINQITAYTLELFKLLVYHLQLEFIQQNNPNLYEQR